MSSRSGPRSVSDATRFTSTTPQPKSKTSAAANAGPVGETLEQRVARLRAAHLAARNAPISRYDRITEGGRKVFDVMHKATLAGLIGFTVIAGVFSVYAVMDMLKYNRKRREDFMEAQRRIEHDALDSARLAFLNGSATEEQARLVEEAIREADRTGQRLPPLLSGPADRRLPAKAEELRNKVRGAFEQEKANQRNGGPLDQLGLETGAAKQGSGKSWWKPW
ncbi:unnamed protein product [Parascedosporium putredinis]|uniref:Uncharacterized protein n=1 Tax=Parascedosporium putredinis TaxID=1442378 RepID=A0A9P1H0Y4_9PEZI|nr:unnamed protein product [Parascedosporium putredinis]CAI7992267.1 unnamed protein product [Parascedosporium putredinis]